MYTKGKWEIVGNSIYARPEIDQPELVCYVQGENREANAHLIAKAPRMYEAVKLARYYLESMPGKPSAGRDRVLHSLIDSLPEVKGVNNA